MVKHRLLTLVYLVSILASCTKDPMDTLQGPRYVPKAIYFLDNPSMDTSNPTRVHEYTYDGEGYITSFRFRNYFPGNPDRSFQVLYNSSRGISAVADPPGTVFNYTYEDGRVRAIRTSNTSSHFAYDTGGRLTVRVDTFGVGSYLRSDSLLYSYTDTSLKIRRIIEIAGCCKNEAQSNFFSFDKSVNNPFMQVAGEGQFYDNIIVPFTDQLRFSRSGFLKRFRMVRLTGEVDSDQQREVMSFKPGTRFPEAIRVSNLTSGTSKLEYLFIVYQRLP